MMTAQTNSAYELDGQNLYKALTFKEPRKSVHVFIARKDYHLSLSPRQIIHPSLERIFTSH